MTGLIGDHRHRRGQNDVPEDNSQPLPAGRTRVGERAKGEWFADLADRVRRAKAREQIHALARSWCRTGKGSRDRGLRDQKGKPGREGRAAAEVEIARYWNPAPNPERLLVERVTNRDAGAVARVYWVRVRGAGNYRARVGS